MRRWLWLMLVPLLMAQDYNVPFRPRAAAGDPCSGATDWMETAAHVYFYQDGTLATGDVEDECDQLSHTCTTHDLEDALLADADLSSSDLPAGTTISGAIAADMSDAESDTATSNSGASVLQAARHGDWTKVFWLKITSDVLNDMFIMRSSDENEKRFFYYDSTNDRICSSFYSGGVQTGSLCSSNSSISINTWYMIAYSVDNDGSTGGTDTHVIRWTDGTGDMGSATTTFADNTDPANIGHANGEGWRESGDPDIKIHQDADFHQVLTAAQSCQIMTCGLTGSGTTSSTRQSTYGSCTLP